VSEAVSALDAIEVNRLAAAEVASPRFLRRLLRRPLALGCLAYLLAVVVIAIVAPIAMPHVGGEAAGDLFAVRKGPSWHHLLGTDEFGRDVLNRLLVGARVTVLGVGEALLVVVLLGVPAGLAAGYFRGRTDRALGWLADLIFAMPAIVIVLMVISVFPASLTAAMITFGVLAAPSLMRVVRSATLPVRSELYVTAAEVTGLSRPYIIFRHVLPRIAGAVIVQTSLLAAAALIVQTGLAFLNLVTVPPAPSWGGMVADGIGQIVLQPWLIWPPGIVIALAVLALGLLGDAVRDASTEAWMPAPARRQTPIVVGERLPSSHTPRAGALLAVDGLGVELSLPGGRRVPVVEGVSFDVARGETVGLVGESGCGKTVTAVSILGLLPQGVQIASGSIDFDGRDLRTLSEGELERVRGREIGFVSQEPMISLNPVFRVGWQLADGIRRHHGVSRKAARARVLELLARVHLPDPAAVAHRYPHQLSGGMAQRVSIARALAGDPQLLIADEPTTALDVTVQAEILDLLREVQAEHRTAIVLVTHDWGVVADICERALVMYAGQLVEQGEIETIFREPRHPYTEALLASNPHGAPEAEHLPTIPGLVPKPGDWPTGCRFHPRCRYATATCSAGPIPLLEPAPGRESRCIHHDRLSLVAR
jgi:peptide/nickel transport system permease protein